MEATMRTRARSKTRLLAVAAVVVTAAFTVFTTGAVAGKQDSGQPSHLTIAYLPGLGSAPFVLMKQLKVIERQYPQTTVEWKVLGTPAAITTGFIAGQIDIAALGVTPVLVGWARGVGWRALAGVNQADLWLMAKDPSIKTLSDLEGRRVATTGITSDFAVVLRKIAQVKLGDAHALDNGLVSLDQPTAMQALLSGQIDAHFAGPPFSFQEQRAGARVLARSSQYFGAHEGLLAVAGQNFYDDHTAFAQWFYEQMKAMDKLIQTNPLRVAHILQDGSSGEPTWRQFKQWIGNPAETWTTRPLGLMRFANFMFKTQQLSKMPSSWHDLVFPTLDGENGS
jgi:NitT/TauT family transport system substrate-binding protein